MTYHVRLQGVPRAQASRLRRAARQALVHAGAPPGELTLRLTDAEEMRRLNAVYAHDDHPTDVLSFPAGDPIPGTGGNYFGDIAIALPMAVAQAEAGGHDLGSELSLLTVHGVLHLLGHEHGRAASQAAMWSLQDRILADLGIELRSPPAGPATSARARSRLASFVHAFAGLAHVLRTQRNAWIHACASLAVVALAAWLRVRATEWALLVLSMGLVWLAEFINTALEAIVDLASPEAHPLARVGKDVGAAAVLIAAVAAAVVGLLILGPPALRRLSGG